MVAEKLDISCYYKELVAIAARESGLAQEFISGINSGENAVMRELYLTADPVKRAVAAAGACIRHIADAGSCVIQPGIMIRIVDEGVLGVYNGGISDLRLIWMLGLRMIGLVMILERTALGGLCHSLFRSLTVLAQAPW